MRQKIVNVFCDTIIYMDGKTEKAYFGGGCFWCTEAVYQELKGVMSVMPGYAGGAKKNPTYEEVSSGATGHAEVIEVVYDADTISFRDLLTVFFATHDPTTLNRQGNDVGTQYRSIILYTTDSQRDEAVAFIKELDADKHTPSVVTEIKPFEAFYPAEEYHRNYYRNNTNAPYCQVIISPKLEKLHTRFSELLETP